MSTLCSDKSLFVKAGDKEALALDDSLPIPVNSSELKKIPPLSWLRIVPKMLQHLNLNF